MTIQHFLRLIAAVLFVGGMISHAHAESILNGGFEKWTKITQIPANWDLGSQLIPDGWSIEDRSDESGMIRRVVISPDGSDASFGNYSLLLNGRLVSQLIYEKVKDKKFKVSLMAKGTGGTIKVLMRVYTAPGEYKYVLHVMEMLNAQTGSEWSKYTGTMVVPSTSGGPLPSAASLEIIGKNVLVDNVQVDLSDAERKYSSIVYNIPVAQNPIEINGDFSEQKWGGASGSNFGFVNEGGNLVKRQAEYYLTSDNTNLLICLRTPFEVLKQNARKRDGNIWEDDSYELHINPSPGQKNPPVAYQFIFNSVGAIYDARYLNGLRGATSMDWNCQGLRVASKCKDHVWTLEIAIPLAEIGLQVGKEFGFNLCKNLQNPAESTSLTGQGYFDYDKMVLGRISKDNLSIFWGNTGGIGDDNLGLFARVSNRSDRNRNCEIAFSVDAEKVTKADKRELALPSAAQETIYFNANKRPGGFGEIGLSAQESTDKLAIVAHQINFDTSAMLAQKKNGDVIEYYPTQNKLSVVLSDALCAKVAKVDVSVHRNNVLIQQTTTDKIEFSADKKGQAIVSFAAPQTGAYLVSAVLSDKEGNCLGYIADEIVVQHFAWQNNNSGKDKTIVRPYIPLSQNKETVSCWGRKYTFAGSGLPEQIVSQDEKILAAPIAFAWTDNGAVRHGKNGTLKFQECSEQSVTFTGETIFDTFRIVAHGKIEYDGTIFYDFDLVAAGDAAIPNLHFEIPFRDIKYFQAPNGYMESLWMSCHPAAGEYVDSSVPVWASGYFYIPKGVRTYNSLYFPQGNGTIWNSRNVSVKKMQGDFLPYMTFGNNLYGMCWFTENDRGWRRDSKKPTYEIVREETTANVKINLISKPLKSSDVERISFALAATPVRPRKTGFNYLDWQVMGFGDSSFIDGYGGGAVVKDHYLLDKYLAKIDPSGNRPVLFYIAKPYFPLGDQVSRYFYNEWHTLPEESYNARNTIPTRKYGLDPDNYFAPSGCLYPERIDYIAFNIETLIKENPRVRGIYWDENYSLPCQDLFHKNCGHKLEDGTVQPGLHTYGLRELDKRIQTILQKYNRPFPNMLVHSGLFPPLMSFADINLCESERGTQNLDFIDYWDLPRLENIGAGAWGINPMWIPQWEQHVMQGGPNTVANNRSMLAALKLFDMNIWEIWCLPQLLSKFRKIENTFGISEDNSRFFGYWQKENKKAVSGLPIFVKSSFFVRPGKGALVYLSNLSKAPQKVSVSMDFSQWDLRQWTVIDVETGQEITATGNTLSLDIAAHDFRCIWVK